MSTSLLFSQPITNLVWNGCRSAQLLGTVGQNSEPHSGVMVKYRGTQLYGHLVITDSSFSGP